MQERKSKADKQSYEERKRGADRNINRKKDERKIQKNVTLLDYQILLSVLEKIEQSLKNVLLP